MAETDSEKGGKPGLLARIRSKLFGAGKVPEKTQMLISGVESVEELRFALDEEITRNEVLAGQIERELAALGEQMEQDKDRIKAGKLTDREKIAALRNIKRLQRKVSSSERRLKIYEDNVDIHATILSQVEEMEAMEMKAIKRSQVEEIAVDYEERQETHREFVAAVRSSVPDSDYEDLLEKKELADLEAMIMAEKSAEDAEQEIAEAKEAAQEAVVEAEQVARETSRAVEEPEPEEPRRPPIDELLRGGRVSEGPERELEVE